ncbi:hypothetical protein A8M77_34405 [Variovorax sp. JS1663]|nr:hypothetical protein A8M77_34405 [Variovorax sp. JS1663]
MAGEATQLFQPVSGNWICPPKPKRTSLAFQRRLSPGSRYSTTCSLVPGCKVQVTPPLVLFRTAVLMSTRPVASMVEAWLFRLVAAPVARPLASRLPPMARSPSLKISDPSRLWMEPAPMSRRWRAAMVAEEAIPLTVSARLFRVPVPMEIASP